jgi:enoyl-CoA hydratase
MAYENIDYEPRHMEHVARITLNRPEKLNALSGALLDELFAALAEAEDDDEVKVVLIKGAGRCFCSGYDIGQRSTPGEDHEERPPEYDGRGLSWTFFEKGPRSPMGPLGDIRFLMMRATRWLSLWDYRKITIAQVHNYCLAGGNELAGNCDLLICSDDAVFGHPAGRAIGNLPNSQGALWSITMGLRQAKWLSLSGKTMNAQEALRVGYVNNVVPKDSLEEEANEMAGYLALMEMDFLTLHKKAINRFWEIAGLRSAIFSGVELDSIYHSSEAYTRIGAEFARIRQEQGLKAALDWRDGKFKDGRTSEAAQKAREEK